MSEKIEPEDDDIDDDGEDTSETDLDESPESSEVALLRRELRREIRKIKRGYVSTQTFIRFRDTYLAAKNSPSRDADQDSYLHQIGEAELDKVRQQGAKATLETQAAVRIARKQSIDWWLTFILKIAALISVVGSAYTIMSSHYKP